MGVLHYDIIVTLQLSKSALLCTSSTLCLLFVLCTHLKLTVVPRTSLSVRYLRINLASYQEPRRCSSPSFQISNPRWALRKIRHINFKVIIVFRTCQLNCQLHQKCLKKGMPFVAVLSICHEVCLNESIVQLQTIKCNEIWF